MNSIWLTNLVYFLFNNNNLSLQRTLQICIRQLACQWNAQRSQTPKPVCPCFSRTLRAIRIKRPLYTTSINITLKVNRSRSLSIRRAGPLSLRSTIHLHSRYHVSSMLKFFLHLFMPAICQPLWAFILWMAGIVGSRWVI